VDEDTGIDTAEPLLATAETIHSSVRVRLACGGLSVDDRDTWACEGLLSLTGTDGKSLWRLERATPSPQRGRRGSQYVPREVRVDGKTYPAEVMYSVGEEDCSWRWVYQGAVTGEGPSQMPQHRELMEEPLEGFWERYLLSVLTGEPDVWKYALKGMPVEEKPTLGKRTSILGVFGNGK